MSSQSAHSDCTLARNSARSWLSKRGAASGARKATFFPAVTWLEGLEPQAAANTRTTTTKAAIRATFIATSIAGTFAGTVLLGERLPLEGPGEQAANEVPAEDD